MIQARFSRNYVVNWQDGQRYESHSYRAFYHEIVPKLKLKMAFPAALRVSYGDGYANWGTYDTSKDFLHALRAFNE